MSSKRRLLDRAVKDLARFNGLYTTEDLATRVSLEKVQGSGANIRSALSINTPEESAIMKEFLDDSESCYFIKDLVEVLSNKTKEDQGAAFVGQNSLRDRMNEVFEIYHTAQTHRKYYGEIEAKEVPTINDVLGYADGSSDSTIINSFPSRPSKDNPSLSAVISNSHRISLSSKNINSTVLWLNSMPTVELSRAVPFVDVRLYIAKQPINERTKQIQTLSLPRFIMGAQTVDDGSPLHTMARSNVIDPDKASPFPREGVDEYSVSGMEIFTSPQTLNSAGGIESEKFRATKTLDTMSSFLTLKDLTLNVAQSTGIMSYKSGTMSLTLHDRSRLSEVADFIKPDLYSTNEIEIEYGWMHPDGENMSSPQRNPYGDFINGLRSKEKYIIVNSSMTMGAGSTVNINLSIAMRGSTEFSTELISTDTESVNSVIREIEDLQKVVAEYRARVFGRENGYQTREIRGIQILDAASDAMRFTTYTDHLKKELAQFKAALAKSENPNSQKLVEAIEEMYVSKNGNRRKGIPATVAKVDKLRNSVVESISNKLSKMSNTSDPFFIGAPNLTVAQRGTSGRNLDTAGKTTKDKQKINNERALYRPKGGFAAGSTSLAKLFLLFIGEPLANTRKFDDIQFIFYPFNAYAGYANQINIGNFVVDNGFFAECFVRWRLETIGRSSMMNLGDFVRFVAGTIIEDPAAPSYGLTSLFSGGEKGRAQMKDDHPLVHSEKINKTLQGVTPDASFRMPQIEIYIETQPRKKIAREGIIEDSGENVMRIHVFDRLATSYDTLGSLLSNVRDTELASIGNIQQAPAVMAGDTGATGNARVVKERERIHNLFLDTAEKTYGIIKRVPTDSIEGANSIYRITGGPKKVKEFLYNTMPYIQYGRAGTTISNASLTSIQDSALNTVNLLRSFRTVEIDPNGEAPGGLPLRIIPTEMNLTCLGCPFIEFSQSYFVDFDTGTTADNIYSVVGITHKFTPGSYRTDIKFAPNDAYGKYDSILSRARQAQAVLQDIENEKMKNN